jgi:hypothetical protein
MTISKYSKNLYSSEVYRELERQAVRNGFFNPSEEDIVKNASKIMIKTASDNSEIFQSEDLIQDIVLLTTSLRRKGLDKYADNIEDKLLIYKQAESLYNLELDSNKDIEEFAHRDGDVQIVDGGELGLVETTQSIAEKILAVVHKEPTGKLPKGASVSDIAKLIKKAQNPFQLTNNFKDETELKTDTINQDIKTSTEQIKNGLNVISNELMKIQSINFNGLIDPSTKKSSMNYLIGNGLLIELFTRLGGNYEPVFKFGNMFNNAYRGQKESIETIYNFLISNIPNANKYLARIDPGYVVSIPKGALFNNKQFTKKGQMYGTPGTGDIGINKQIQQQKEESQKKAFDPIAREKSSQIFQEISNIYQTAQREVNKVTAKLEEYKRETVNLSEYIKQFADTKLNTLQDYNLFLLNLERAFPNIIKLLGSPKLIFKQFQKNDSITKIDEEVANINNNIKIVIDQVSQSIKDKIPTEILDSTMAILGELQNQLTKDLSNYPEYMKAQKDTLATIKNMRNIIYKNSPAGEAQVLKALIGVDKYKNFEAVQKDVENLKEFLNKLREKASVNKEVNRRGA